MVESFRETLKSGKFIVTSEIGPPKGTNIEKMCHHIDILKDKVDAINVTDPPELGDALPLPRWLPVYKRAWRRAYTSDDLPDRNRMALQADLLFAYTRGIKNVLCLTGDAVPVGDNKEAKGVFEFDSTQLIRVIRQMEKGKDMGGNDLDGTVEFCAGAIVTLRRNQSSLS